MNVTLTPSTGNRKLGIGVAVSTTASSSCPVTCPFKDKGCYARFGPLAIHWKKIDEGIRGFPWAEFIQKMKTLNIGQMFRHNQAGDLPHSNGIIENTLLQQLADVVKFKKLRAWTYTHHLLTPENVASIKEANAKGFTINASTESLEGADKAKSLGLPVVVVVDSNSPNTIYTPAGNKVVICPAQTRESTTCANCGLCTKVSRSVIVGFKAHGTATKMVNKMVGALA